MTRYFFDLYNDTVTLDDEGRELARSVDVHAAALYEAREMMAVGIRAGVLDLSHRIEVRDGKGVVEVVRFGDAVNLTGQS